MYLRILAAIILAISMLWGPFWLTIILALIGILNFTFFFEAAGIMLLADFLYAVSEKRFSGIVFVTFFTTLLIIFLAEFLKKKINLYKK